MTPEKRKYTISCLGRYWAKNSHIIESLPLQEHGLEQHCGNVPTFDMVFLPDWAEDIAVDGGILLPVWALRQAKSDWKKIDWLAVCFWYINCLPERSYENDNGSVHSFSFRLRNWDERAWTHAWVNRIALFLRRWAAEVHGRSERYLFGARPKADIILTHDVDAITKTLSIRVKQTIFHGLNTLRYAMRGKFGTSVQYAKNTLRFLFSQSDYWCFDQILKIEAEAGLTSIFNVYAGEIGGKKNLWQRLIDPSYDVHETRLKNQLRALLDSGWSIGLHQSYESWQDKSRMASEKDNLTSAIGQNVDICRQHWLRFSFAKTWQVQQDVGFSRDCTLGFNDRPGFRNSAALEFCPWSETNDRPMAIKSIPMVLMDSHLYDYHAFDDQTRLVEIRRWIDEIKAVGGVASVIWHQRVLSDDYGWKGGYEQLVSEIIK